MNRDKEVVFINSVIFLRYYVFSIFCGIIWLLFPFYDYIHSVFYFIGSAFIFYHIKIELNRQLFFLFIFVGLIFSFSVFNGAISFDYYREFNYGEAYVDDYRDASLVNMVALGMFSHGIHNSVFEAYPYLWIFAFLPLQIAFDNFAVASLVWIYLFSCFLSLMLFDLLRGKSNLFVTVVLSVLTLILIHPQAIAYTQKSYSFALLLTFPGIFLVVTLMDFGKQRLPPKTFFYVILFCVLMLGTRAINGFTFSLLLFLLCLYRFLLWRKIEDIACAVVIFLTVLIFAWYFSLSVRSASFGLGAAAGFFKDALKFPSYAISCIILGILSSSIFILQSRHQNIQPVPYSFAALNLSVLILCLVSQNSSDIFYVINSTAWTAGLLFTATSSISYAQSYNS